MYRFKEHKAADAGNEFRIWSEHDCSFIERKCKDTGRAETRELTEDGRVALDAWLHTSERYYEYYPMEALCKRLFDMLAEPVGSPA